MAIQDGKEIAQLPAGQRAVLVLRGQQNLDAAEVCDILAITDSNMRVLLHRARFSLRQALDQIGRRLENIGVWTEKFDYPVTKCNLNGPIFVKHDKG